MDTFGDKVEGKRLVLVSGGVAKKRQNLTSQNFISQHSGEGFFKRVETLGVADTCDGKSFLLYRGLDELSRFEYEFLRGNIHDAVVDRFGREACPVVDFLHMLGEDTFKKYDYVFFIGGLLPCVVLRFLAHDNRLQGNRCLFNKMVVFADTKRRINKSLEKYPESWNLGEYPENEYTMIEVIRKKGSFHKEISSTEVLVEDRGEGRFTESIIDGVAKYSKKVLLDSGRTHILIVV